MDSLDPPTHHESPTRAVSIIRDLTAGVVVFLIALPLCLGIALASDAPLFSGLITGIVAGIVVGILSGSHTSVSGPAAGLTAVVAAQINSLGSFEIFLAAVVVGGAIQVVMGLVRAGALSAFVPSSVIRGLLAAIGVIIILKQIPHLVGHDKDPEGEMSFIQPDHETTFSEIGDLFAGQVHYGAIVIGLMSIAILVLWGRIKFLKNSLVPGPLVAVIAGVLVNRFVLVPLGPPWAIGSAEGEVEKHLVDVPVAGSPDQFLNFLTFPDFSGLTSPAFYVAALTIAIVASLETLLNLEAVDRLDPFKRQSPPNRELIAQGIGNMVAGGIGGIPMTSVIIRSSANVNAGARTKLSAIFHGVLLLVCVALLPTYLNMIPLATLAAILIMTGLKLASPKLFRQMWSEGRYQFIPFVVTLVAIVFTDLLIGIIIGLLVATAFILNSNLRRPTRTKVERHVSGEVTVIELANQVSFLNRASLEQTLQSLPEGSQAVIDARATDYIDPDLLALVRDFKNETAPQRGITVYTRGFKSKFGLPDDEALVHFTTSERQQALSPEGALELLKEGNRRFCSGERLSHDVRSYLAATAQGQSPFAAILSCIDSRAPAEVIFDLGLGDIFSVRVAGNVTSGKVLGSLEYAAAVVKVKLIVVLGHTQCGAVTATTQSVALKQPISQMTGCQNLDGIVRDIQRSVDPSRIQRFDSLSPAERSERVEEVTDRNVAQSVRDILSQSQTIAALVANREVAIIGAKYDVASGQTEFFEDLAAGFVEQPRNEFEELAAAGR